MSRQPLDETTRKELETRLGALERPVKLLFFGQGSPACGNCREQETLLEAVAAASDRVTLEKLDLVKDTARARELGVDKVPATLVLGEGDEEFGIRFYGITSGYEFSSLVEAIEMVGSGRSGLPEELERLALLVDRPTHLEVMVTLTCPYCPKMVRLAHQLAFVKHST